MRHWCCFSRSWMAALRGPFSRCCSYLPSLLNTMAYATILNASLHSVFQSLLVCAMYACDMHTRGQVHRQASCWSTLVRPLTMLLFRLYTGLDLFVCTPLDGARWYIWDILSRLLVYHAGS